MANALLTPSARGMGRETMRYITPDLRRMSPPTEAGRVMTPREIEILQQLMELGRDDQGQPLQEGPGVPYGMSESDYRLLQDMRRRPRE